MGSKAWLSPLAATVAETSPGPAVRLRACGVTSLDSPSRKIDIDVIVERAEELLMPHGWRSLSDADV
jgi:hypothetical protein